MKLIGPCHNKYKPRVLNWGNFTGKMLIDVQQGNMQVWTFYVCLTYTNDIFQCEVRNGKGLANLEFMLQDLVRPPPHTAQVDFFKFESILPLLADFCTHRDVDCIQLFDLALLLSNAAYDDNTMFEVLTEKWQEVIKYDKVTILLFKTGLTWL